MLLPILAWNWSRSTWGLISAVFLAFSVAILLLNWLRNLKLRFHPLMFAISATNHCTSVLAYFEITQMPDIGIRIYLLAMKIAIVFGICFTSFLCFCTTHSALPSNLHLFCHVNRTFIQFSDSFFPQRKPYFILPHLCFITEELLRDLKTLVGGKE